MSQCNGVFGRCSLLFNVRICTELIICSRILTVLSVIVDGVDVAVIW